MTRTAISAARPRGGSRRSGVRRQAGPCAPLPAPGFRAPSLFERFGAFGDPTLKPEDSRSYEVGIERGFATGTVSATLFYIEVDNLIDFDPAATACGSGFGCFNQVPGTTTSQGLELAWDFDVSEMLTVYGNYTYTDAENSGRA